MHFIFVKQTRSKLLIRYLKKIRTAAVKDSHLIKQARQPLAAVIIYYKISLTQPQS